METTAKTEPLAVQKFAQQQSEGVDKDLKKEETKQRDAMKNKRKSGLAATSDKQKKQKSNLEKKREEVAAKINGIYTTAQDNVKKKLADLETESMKRFDDGNAKAAKQFEDDVNRDIDAFKEDRYSGWFGWARRVRDWVKGIDELPQVKAIFDRNKAKFEATINKLVTDISADNKRVIQECKDELQRARNEIKDFVDKLGPALKDIGKQSAEEMNSKLNEMDKFVAKKEEDLQEKLKEKQTAAIKAIDEKIEKMKEAMAGALAKLGKFLLWAAKKFFTWALEKFGFSLSDIEGIINKGVAVLKAIFTQPIQFVKNLMKAAITGFENFGKNFLKHLQDALFEWLTGSLQGIKLPSSWDPKGIVGVALEIIGISYDNIRKHMVTVMTEPVVRELERGFKLVKTLIVDGPMAAWDQLKEMAVEMKDAFVDAVKDFIKMKIIEEAIKWVVSLFIPGAGIIKAVIGIYDTVVFFIKKAKQIMQMLGNFLSSISEIAAGNIGAAADAMEKGLARGLSLVISFLAQLLHLSGITNKIKEALQKIKGKVDGVLLKIAKWIGAQAKKLWGGVKETAGKVMAWWKIKQPFTGADGKPHTISVDRKDNRPVITVRSDEAPLLTLIKAQSQPKRGKLETKYAEVEKLFGGKEPDEKQQQKRHDQVQKLISEIAKSLGPGDIRPTVVTHSQTTGNRARRIIAEPLTPQAGNTKSSESHGVQRRELLELLLKPRAKGFTMFSSAHLLSHVLHGPAEEWNLANTGKSLNKQMEQGPEAIGKKAKGKGVELKYVTDVDYYGGFPPTDPAKLKAGSPAQKLKWLGGLVAEKYTVKVSLATPPTPEAAKLGLPQTFDCADKSDFLSDLEIIGGKAPPTNAEKVLEVATDTAEKTPNGKRVRGIVFLAREVGIGTDVASRALEQLAKERSLEVGDDGRYYLRS